MDDLILNNSNRVRGRWLDEKTGIEFDIQKIEKIDKGFQVFARGWKNGKQLGFGEDGSVDIERFKFINMPTVVEDPAGDKEIRIRNVDNVIEVIKLKENPLSSLRIHLADTMRIAGKEGTNITPGKIGNTTATVFGISGAMGSLQGPDNSNYTTIHNAATATANTAGVDTQNEFFSPNYLIYRSPMIFDTSTIPSGSTVSSAVMSITPSGTTRSGDGSSATIVSFTGSATTLANADYDVAKWGTTSGGAALLSTLTSGAYRDITLNATGIGYLTLGGSSKLGLRDSGDIASTVPGGINARLSAQGTGGAAPPKLVITYTAPVVKPNFLAFM